METSESLSNPNTRREQNPLLETRCKAFVGDRCIAAGELIEVARKAKAVIDEGVQIPVLIFDEMTSRLIEIDFRGTPDQVVERLPKSETAEPVASEPTEKRGPGRPKLGVIAREVTLLPRHWEWLNEQPGGASVVLRKLVEEARRSCRWKDQARQSQEAAYRFMSTMAGNFPGFEEAIRAFYARNYERFHELITPWPEDVRNHVKQLVDTLMKDEASALENH